MEQKFTRGNLVRICKEMPSHMSHFECDRDAIVMYSYADKYGGDDCKSYSLMFVDTGSECSWYDEYQLTLIHTGGQYLIDETLAVAAKRKEKFSDLDWIVANYISIKDTIGGYSCEALMKAIGIDKPWGNAGEGWIWQRNWLVTLSWLEEALLSGDRAKLDAAIEVAKVKAFKKP